MLLLPKEFDGKKMSLYIRMVDCYVQNFLVKWRKGQLLLILKQPELKELLPIGTKWNFVTSDIKIFVQCLNCNYYKISSR